MMTDLLKKIDCPADLRRLSENQLPKLADELRNYIVEQVAKTGGHLSSNLGTVELTVALHYVFNTPNDRVVWDVGHQTYPHKILTGRRDAMPGLRQYGGISGFPKRSESEYDAFGTAHSSTSISAALGMAVASRNLGVNRKHIAVIGDGSMTAGMAFEALNNAGVTPDIDLLVILNDNDMSISPPVGALNKYLAKLLSGRMLNNVKEVGKGILGVAPPLYELAHRLEEHVKGMMSPATLFEEFGFNYYGPIDGHDLDALVPTLQNLRAMKGPIFLHVITKKGAGYKLAEQDPVLYHGPGKFDPSVGIQKSNSPKPPTYTQIFGKWLCDMAQSDRKLVGITPAMREGSGMVEFERRFPSRYFDVGIAEQHAVTFAAGLACEGMKPVVAIYSTFLQRAYDQLIHDVALQNLDVTFALDRAGLVGADGATHAGNYDIAYLRCIPNMVIAAPSNEDECRKLLTTAYHYPGCASVRYPRGVGPGVVADESLDTVEIGKAIVRYSPDESEHKLVILAFGSMCEPSLEAGRALGATVVDMRWVKPIDAELLQRFAEQRYSFVTVEEGCIMGGAGSAVTEHLHAQGFNNAVLQLGLPDEFIDHGDPALLLKNLGLDAQGIETSIKQHYGELFDRHTNVVRHVAGRAANT
ncbi:MAG: 1-deoxy-D-xylulose-5-phosphate synthase [Limnobacter sp. CACIAM 66H1]|uniref:1-deoxy-D-xylulose-5-phosphate synthase n=1 Tax=unclassified Limnobacter TaxID=2630203 RepID=UPI0007A840C2|nr:1-deoxy-D-xylulose-5-phosphate synthase [Limnobacter sp. CACIAM 66H1]KYP12377.1 MAG: 1-deoxy-D-xylulose-5-phosphate synthase [Limnobacter sp. CACIAM 66H1]